MLFFLSFQDGSFRIAHVKDNDKINDMIYLISWGLNVKIIFGDNDKLVVSLSLLVYKS